MNVIIFLWEDFIYYFLEYNWNVNLDFINRDIFSKNYIYYIGDFFIEDVKFII